MLLEILSLKETIVVGFFRVLWVSSSLCPSCWRLPGKPWHSWLLRHHSNFCLYPHKHHASSRMCLCPNPHPPPLFFWRCPWHEDVPGPGMGSEPQQWQWRILNPLSHQGTPQSPHFIKTPVLMDEGPTLLTPYEFILTDDVYGDYCQGRSHSEVLRVKVSSMWMLADHILIRNSR